MMKLVSENEYKIIVPLSGVSISSVSPTKIGKIQGLFRA